MEKKSLAARSSVQKCTVIPATLSAIVAHELNNISVPLRGFHDIAAQSDSSVDLLMQCLDEMRIGVERLSKLSIDLESLSELGSNRVATAIADCILPGDHRIPDYSQRVRWLCKPSQTVLVDPQHARRAVGSLARLSSGVIELVTLARRRETSRCSGCDQAISPATGFVVARAHELRAAAPVAFRNPFDPETTSLSSHRLTAAAMTHCAHRAGGHLIADRDTGILSVLFPVG